MKDLLKNPQPSKPEFLVALFFTFLAVIAVTQIDINIHDGYVLDDIADCHPNNDSQRCEELRKEMGCESADQLCLGDRYQATLMGIVILLGFILAFTRLVLGKLAGAKTSISLLFIAFLWFASGIILFYFGWLDTLYFIMQKEPIPVTLDWLNNVGLFKYVQNFGATIDVNNTDLYILNLVGLIVFFGMWYIAEFHYKKRTLAKLGIK